MKAEGVRAAWDKYKHVILVMVLGAGLMVWPAGRRNSVSAEASPPERDLQRELQETLGKIEGVGRVWALLTEESDGSRTLASDRKVSFRGDAASPAEYSESVQTILTDAGNVESVVVTRTEYPTYRGALIVCDGGNRPEVKLAVTQAVTALTGLPASRVAVVKCQ